MLAESADIKTDAFRDLYAPFGEDVVARCVEHHTHHAGLSRVLKIKKYHQEFLGEDLSPEDLDGWVARYSAIVEDKVVLSPAVPGAVEFLQTYGRDLRCFVISGTPDEELQRIVDARGWRSCFEEVHGSPRLKPDIIEDILMRTGLRRDRVLFVGDAMTDYNAAKDTALRFVGRVASHHENMFPANTLILVDLTNLGEVVVGA